MAVGRRRTQIPKFSAAEIKQATLCAKALWYGVCFEKGKEQTSDAAFLETFATQFYQLHRAGRFFPPPIMVKELHELIKTARVYVLYRGIAGMDLAGGIRAIRTTLLNQYRAILRGAARRGDYKAAANCLKDLSDNFVKKRGGNRLVLASRLMFYLTPDLQTFNLNNAIATAYGLPTRPHYHYDEFYRLMNKGLITNQNALGRLRLPADLRNELTQPTWHKVKKTNWWRRRVLDIAILIRLRLAKPHLNLRGEVCRLLSQKLGRRVTNF